MAWRDVVFPKREVTQGRRDEVNQAPPSLDHNLDSNDFIVPPTYVYTQRRRPKPLVDRLFWGLPASNQQNARWMPNTPETMRVSGWHDAPDPVRQSNFVAEGNKIHPFGGDITPLHTALWKANIMEDSFRVGKLREPLTKSMYAGTQLPSSPRQNISPGQAITLGSKFTVNPTPITNQPIVLASGFSGAGLDGYPY